MRSLRLLTILTAAVVAGACGDSTGLEAVDLEGTWSASAYEYTDNADPQSVVDIIQRDGASFSMTVDAAGSVSTVLDDGVGGTSSNSGTFSSTGNTLTLGSVVYSANRNGDVLTLTNADAEFDFGSGSAVSATLRIVLAR